MVPTIMKTAAPAPSVPAPNDRQVRREGDPEGDEAVHALLEVARLQADELVPSRPGGGEGPRERPRGVGRHRDERRIGREVTRELRRGEIVVDHDPLPGGDREGVGRRVAVRERHGDGRVGAHVVERVRRERELARRGHARPWSSQPPARRLSSPARDRPRRRTSRETTGPRWRRPSAGARILRRPIEWSPRPRKRAEDVRWASKPLRMYKGEGLRGDGRTCGTRVGGFPAGR